MHPAAHRLLVAIEPLGNLRAAFAIHQQQDAMVRLPQSHIVCSAKSRPHLLARPCRVRDRQHAQALLPQTPSLISAGPEKTGNYFVGSLWSCLSWWVSSRTPVMPIVPLCPRPRMCYGQPTLARKGTLALSPAIMGIATHYGRPPRCWRSTLRPVAVGFGGRAAWQPLGHAAQAPQANEKIQRA